MMAMSADVMTLLKESARTRAFTQSSFSNAAVSHTNLPPNTIRINSLRMEYINLTKSDNSDLPEIRE
jgi:hypothetical protein